MQVREGEPLAVRRPRGFVLIGHHLDPGNAQATAGLSDVVSRYLDLAESEMRP